MPAAAQEETRSLLRRRFSKGSNSGGFALLTWVGVAAGAFPPAPECGWLCVRVLRSRTGC